MTRSQMTRRTIPCEDILFDNPNDELLVQPIGNADVVVTQAVGEIDGSIAVTAAEEESTVGVSVVIPNPCATVTEGVLISMPIENHLDGDLVVQVLQHDPGTNSSVVVASTTVGTAEDVNLEGIAVSSGDFTLEVVSEAGADFVVGAIHYMTTEQLSENFVIVECNTDNIYGNDYRFGFNGQQKDNELKGLGNSLDFKFRVYDSRLGKFLSVDPLKKDYPWNSTYAFAENRVIDGKDLEGREWDFYLATFTGDNNSQLRLVPYDRLDSKIGNYDMNEHLMGSGTVIRGNDNRWHEVPKEWQNKSLSNIGNPEEIMNAINSWEARDDVGDALTATRSLEKLGGTAEAALGVVSIADGIKNLKQLRNIKLGARQHVPTGAMKGKTIGHTFQKHGSHNTRQLQMESKNTGQKLGQWVDDAAAEKFIADNLGKLKNGAKTIDLPEGLGRIVNPDGTFSKATKARLVPSGSGVKTAYPIPE